MSLLRIERDGPLGVLRLDKGRGNAIDEPLLAELLSACRALETDDGVRGVLLASAHPKLFCPGLDLVSLFAYDRPALERFLGLFSEALFALFALEKPMLAAVAGHAVAGGCVLALTADLRLLRRGSQIGLNEVKVGVPLPWPVAILLRSQVGPLPMTEVALLGNNFADEAAVAAGLAHAVLEVEGFEAACRARLVEFVDRDARSVALTKRYLRAAALLEMRSRDRELAGEWLDAWFSAATRERIQKIVGSLAR